MNTNLENYILQHIDEEPAFLKKLSRKVHVQLLYSRMLSGHLQGRILYMLTRLIQPRKILELGTYAGYSALCMAEALPQNGHIDTIEINDELEDFINEAFLESGYSNAIKLWIGDALNIIPTLPGMYDMVLLDANKRDYCAYYEAAMQKLNTGGVILADNVLWDGKVLEVPENKDQQTKGIQTFNDMVAADKRVEKVILPVRDGLTIIRKVV